MTQPLSAVGGAAPAAPAVPGRPAAERTKEGEGFERMLLTQLTKTLADSAFGDEQTASAASSAYRDMLPDALTEALMSGGGIGLAAALQQEDAA